MASPAPAHVEGAAYAVASSSSSAPSTSPRKAVMLKGPSLTSKTYFVPLPDTLDQLVAKAVELFPIPPGKVPHITLGTDERAIVLQDSFDFIRDRELLHFRWSAETPRRNLANRVRWDQPSASVTPSSQSASAAASSSEDTLPASLISAAESLKAQLQNSPLAKRDLASATRANTIANRDPNTQFGEGVAARKAHAQRVLAEQQRKLEEEHSADALGTPAIVSELDNDMVIDTDAEATAKAALELAATEPAVPPTQYPSSTTEAEQQAVDAEKEQASPVEHAVPELPSPEAEAAELVHASAAEAIGIESPPRKKQIDNGGLDTPPSSGSRSSSPFHSSDRASNTRRVDADDEPSSSPISSPTRDVSSRHRHLHVGSIPELGQWPANASEEAQVTPEATDATSSDPFALQPGAIVVSDEAAPTEAAQDATTASPEATSSKPRDGQNDLELNRIYGFLSNLVLQLLSHKANLAFQRPMSVEFEQFAARTSRPVDLFTIRDNLKARKYGSQLLEGRMAANAVVTGFEDDLALLYANARQFFGVRSPQGECVDHLEKFSRSFLSEYKRNHGAATLPKASWGASSDLASARLSAFRSPGSRSEKRVAPPSAPFASLLTPRSGASITSGSAKRMVGQPPAGNALGVMRRPDFGFARNVSYDSTMAPKRAQSSMTTSEAFEKALRAASATPQADRIKPRQEIVAPFATRSVIESDFMTRLPAQPQEQPEQAAVAQTPSGLRSKRKLASPPTADAAETEIRSPSVSPPPSPSPTKRTKQMVVKLKPSKSAARRNKKKAKLAAAAAAAAAEQDQGTVEEDEEESVVGLLTTEPARKRARTTKGVQATESPESSQKTRATAEVVLPLMPSTPSGRMLRPRRTSTSANERDSVPPPKTPPRSCKKAAFLPIKEAPVETMEVDGFEVTASRRRSSRQRKPVNLD